MSEPHDAVIERVRVREAAGIFHAREALDALRPAGFDRARIDLMAGVEAVREKLGDVYVAPTELPDVPGVPRKACVAREDVAIPLPVGPRPLAGSGGEGPEDPRGPRRRGRLTVAFSPASRLPRRCKVHGAVTGPTFPTKAFWASVQMGVADGNITSAGRGKTMSVLDILWLFFILSALQPVIRQRMLETMRKRKIAQIERDRNSRVILLVHRQETMRLLGFPVVRYIDVNDSEEVLRAVQMTDDNIPLDLVLHTPGGIVLAALQIARAIRGHKAKVTVFVPHYAMSGGTLIALAANEIVMSQYSVLGPVDPQLGRFPAASLIKVVDQKPVAEIDDETLILADVGRKAIAQIKTAAREFLDGNLPADQAEALAEKLSTGTWTHDYPISPDEGKKLGLPISTEMPDHVLQLMALYPQPVRSSQTGGVEYLPEPREKEPTRRLL